MTAPHPDETVPRAGLSTATRLRAPRRRRLLQLLVGLVAYGVSDAMLVLSGLGLFPWDVLHQGLARSSVLSIGQWSIAVGALLLVAWVPLRQRPGLGTVANVVLIGLTLDAVLAVVDPPEAMAARVALLLGGVVGNGMATAAYIGAGLGPGPRDGLMTGLARRTGRSVRLVRTVIEVTVLAVGAVLGGTVGIGTVLYATAIGPLTQLFLVRFDVDARSASAPPV